MAIDRSSREVIKKSYALFTLGIHSRLQRPSNSAVREQLGVGRSLRRLA